MDEYQSVLSYRSYWSSGSFAECKNQKSIHLSDLRMLDGKPLKAAKFDKINVMKNPILLKNINRLCKNEIRMIQHTKREQKQVIIQKMTHLNHEHNKFQNVTQFSPIAEKKDIIFIEKDDTLIDNNISDLEKVGSQLEQAKQVEISQQLVSQSRSRIQNSQNQVEKISQKPIQNYTQISPLFFNRQSIKCKIFDFYDLKQFEELVQKKGGEIYYDKFEILFNKDIKVYSNLANFLLNKLKVYIDFDFEMQIHRDSLLLMAFEYFHIFEHEYYHIIDQFCGGEKNINFGGQKISLQQLVVRYQFMNVMSMLLSTNE
ncbi:hypothetical protein SS50377_26348 [Spironucleus salmonicida]|uniref:Uncharacterized protein n=1 Tax=Spironucleus salmonicida TaxID=348837 RepID=V6M3C8_9EUKA|nr:hypothetical protein SS50377_26348 [Spironucleus salmonicida]|eukprot:EST47784.1 Hypothetical protein SS50377_12184 [Spironucleus salmonicida]